MIVAFTGMPGSGKSEAAQMASELGFEVVRMGDLVEAMSRDEDLPVGEIADRERKLYGDGIWAQRTLNLLKDDRTAIDGLRGMGELEVFRKGCRGDFYLIAVWASTPTRNERLIRRGRGDLEEIERRDLRELSWGLGDSIAMADHMMINEGGLETFREEVLSLLRSQVDDA